ncbi:MAG: hypothetical protein C4K49_08935 [Candidatus Thorarchaeota archaeon]|nr:MAG: hypothetical protein C4K49_08935 [Candidatus Thorarchaeota archaeon]
MHPMKELLPVSAILLVIVMMSGVDLFIIGEPSRLISVIPIVLVLVIWLVATLKVRRSEDVR